MVPAPISKHATFSFPRSQTAVIFAACITMAPKIAQSGPVALQSGAAGDETALKLPASFSTLPPELLILIFEFSADQAEAFFGRFICKAARAPATVVFLRAISDSLKRNRNAGDAAVLIQSIRRRGSFFGGPYDLVLSRPESLAGLILHAGLNAASDMCLKLVRLLRPSTDFLAEMFRSLRITPQELCIFLDDVVANELWKVRGGLTNFAQRTGLEPEQILWALQNSDTSDFKMKWHVIFALVDELGVPDPELAEGWRDGRKKTDKEYGDRIFEDARRRAAFGDQSPIEIATPFFASRSSQRVLALMRVSPWSWQDRGSLYCSAITRTLTDAHRGTGNGSERAIARAEEWALIIEDLRFIFGHEYRDWRTTVEDAQDFFSEVPPRASFGIVVACFLMDDVWPVTESWQVWDMISKESFLENEISMWLPDCLTILQQPEQRPVDSNRFLTFVKWLGMDLGQACWSWLSRSATRTYPELIGMLLQESFEIAQHRWGVLSHFIPLVSAVRRDFDEILGWHFGDPELRIAVFAGMVTKLVTQRSDEEYWTATDCKATFVTPDKLRNFTHHVVELLRLDNVNDEEIWQAEVAELLITVWDNLCGIFGECFDAGDENSAWHLATWHLARSFGVDFLVSSKTETEIVKILKGSHGSTVLERIFRSPVDVLAFADGFVLNDDARARPPDWDSWYPSHLRQPFGTFPVASKDQLLDWCLGFRANFDKMAEER